MDDDVWVLGCEEGAEAGDGFLIAALFAQSLLGLNEENGIETYANVNCI